VVHHARRSSGFAILFESFWGYMRPKFSLILWTRCLFGYMKRNTLFSIVQIAPKYTYYTNSFKPVTVSWPKQTKVRLGPRWNVVSIRWCWALFNHIHCIINDLIMICQSIAVYIMDTFWYKPFSIILPERKELAVVYLVEKCGESQWDLHLNGYLGVLFVPIFIEISNSIAHVLVNR